jgi:type II pantothenate kinase
MSNFLILCSDIYGGDYGSLGLHADMTAGFFAKFVSKDTNTLKDGVSDADICHGLLLMITNNIGQLAYLQARLHQIDHIFFSGTFLRHSAEVDIAPVALTRAIEFWSNGEMKALFLKHEGYFGALVIHYICLNAP